MSVTQDGMLVIIWIIEDYPISYLADLVGHFSAEDSFWCVRQSGVQTIGHLLPAFSVGGLMIKKQVD